MHRCQIQSMPGMADELQVQQILWQKRNRIKRFVKRRWLFAMNRLGNMLSASSGKERLGIADHANQAPLQAGDAARVRSRHEIQATLDNWNQLKHCSFMEEMWPYCDTNQQVLKRVEKFLDERDYLLKKCKGIVILKDVMCQGTRDFGPCDRSCFFFWREEWLEKLDGQHT